MYTLSTGSGEGVHGTLLSDTLKPNGLTGTGTRSGVWFRNKPTDLSACVRGAWVWGGLAGGWGCVRYSGTSVPALCLLLSDKTRAKEKTYVRVSV